MTATEPDVEIEIEHNTAVSAERLEREAAFQDHVSDTNAREEAKKFYAICKNSYDHFYRLIYENARDKDVLEYGCGMGSNVYDLTRRGARVTGIDISPVALEYAERRAEDEGLG